MEEALTGSKGHPWSGILSQSSLSLPYLISSRCRQAIQAKRLSIELVYRLGRRTRKCLLVRQAALYACSPNVDHRLLRYL